LLKAAEEEQLNSSVSPLAAEQSVSAQAPSQTRTTSAPHTGLDWDDDEIFDELLAAVPQGKTATDVHSPFNPVTAEKTSRIVEDMVNVAPAMAAMATAHGVKNSALQADLDDLGDLLIEEDEPSPSQPVRSSSYAQSSAFVQAPIQHQG